MDPLILAATVGTAKGGGVSREAGDEDTIPFSENVEMRREMNGPVVCSSATRIINNVN